MMNRTFLRLQFRIPEEHQEAVIARLTDFGFYGFEQEDDTVAAWTEADPFSRQSQTDFDRWLEAESLCTLIGRETHAERNWNEEWEQSIRPQTVGKFYIHPAWADEPNPQGTIPLVIDPKMSFGTGYHETTRLLLHMLPSFVMPGDRVLDMGSGTGILAIAALKLGAAHAVCVDVDAWCFDNAGENARRNGVEDVMDIRIGSAEQMGADEKFDIVLANINRNVLLDLAGELGGMTKPGGCLLISGIVRDDEQSVLSHPDYSQLSIEDTKAENEWYAIGLRKPEQNL